MKQIFNFLYSFPPLSWKRKRDELLAEIQSFRTISRQLQADAMALRDEIFPLTDELTEILKHNELLRNGLGEIGALLESGRTAAAHERVKDFLGEVSK